MGHRFVPEALQPREPVHNTRTDKREISVKQLGQEVRCMTGIATGRWLDGCLAAFGEAAGGECPRPK